MTVTIDDRRKREGEGDMRQTRIRKAEKNGYQARC